MFASVEVLDPAIQWFLCVGRIDKKGVDTEPPCTISNRPDVCPDAGIVEFFDTALHGLYFAGTVGVDVAFMSEFIPQVGVLAQLLAQPLSQANSYLAKRFTEGFVFQDGYAKCAVGLAGCVQRVGHRIALHHILDNQQKTDTVKEARSLAPTIQTHIIVNIMYFVTSKRSLQNTIWNRMNNHD